MKNLVNFNRRIWYTLIFAGIAILQSCAVNHPNSSNAQLLSVPDIIQMSKDRVSSKDIIAEIQKSHTAYDLKADQLVKLHDQGVQDSVLNYMEQTKLDLIQQNQHYADQSYWWMANGFYYGFFGLGWPYYGYWPYYNYGWYMGPTVIYRGVRSYHAPYHENYHSTPVYHGGGISSGRRR